MDVEIIASNFVSTIAGGLILALLFFWMRENIFPLPRVMGIWYFEVHTSKTAYIPYKGMILRYTAMLWREGNKIQGTVEKIYEDSSTGQREFVGKNRTRGILEGYLEKKYFLRTAFTFMSWKKDMVENQQVITTSRLIPIKT